MFRTVMIQRQNEKQNEESGLGKMQRSIKENRGNDPILQYSSYDVKDSSSHFVGHLSDPRMVSGNNEAKEEKIDNAWKVFAKMPIIENFKQEGTVQEYYDEFNSLFGNRGLNESYVVDLFIWGLDPEIVKGVKWLKPKSLSDAFCLAKLQESINQAVKMRYNVPLLSSPKLENSSEEAITVEEKNIGLMGLDVHCKEDAKDDQVQPKEG